MQSATMFSFFFLHWFTIFLLCSLLLYRRVCHSAGCILYGTNLHTAKLNSVIRCALRQETRDTSIKLMAKWFSCIGIPYYLNNRFIHMNLLHFRIVPYAICVNVSKLFFFSLINLLVDCLLGLLLILLFLSCLIFLTSFVCTACEYVSVWLCV